MKEVSAWRVVLGVMLVVALIAAGAALAWMAYNAGLTQAATQAPGARVEVAPTFGYRPMYWGPFGFGFLGCLVPLAFLFLVFGLFRLVVFGGMGRHPMHGGWGPRGWGGPEGMRDFWHQRLNEWHREAHAPGSGEVPSDKRPS